MPLGKTFEVKVFRIIINVQGKPPNSCRGAPSRNLHVLNNRTSANPPHFVGSMLTIELNVPVVFEVKELKACKNDIQTKF